MKKSSSPQASIQIENILFKNRNVFLYEEVNDESAKRVIRELMALDYIAKKPIYLWLNSPGGSCCAGLAIIETMKRCKSKIITIINSEVCSMGGHISICGNERWIVKSGIWMAHDMSSGVRDYSLKIKDRADFLEKYYTLLEENLKNHTKLSNEQINKARTGELWLFAQDCLKYKIADKII